MDLLSLIVTFAVIGFYLYLVLTYIPMPDPMKQALIVLVVLVLVVWVARTLLGGTIRLGP